LAESKTTGLPGGLRPMPGPGAAAAEKKAMEDAKAAQKYDPVDSVAPPTTGRPAADPSDTLFTKKGQKLQFYYVPSGRSGPLVVSFKAFLTEYSDNFITDWKKDSVYGRMDPIATYGGTTRKIQVSFSIPAYGEREARVNMRRVSTLIQMLYPVYNKHQGAGQISAAPLLKMKFGNLIAHSHAGETSLQKGSDVVIHGLLGWLDGATFAPDLEAGFYDPGHGMLIPMSLNLSLGFNVLHQHRMGWSQSKSIGAGKGVQPLDDGNKSFPYGMPSFVGTGEVNKDNEVITPKDLGTAQCEEDLYAGVQGSALGSTTDGRCTQPKGSDPVNDAFNKVKENILGGFEGIEKAFGGD